MEGLRRSLSVLPSIRDREWQLRWLQVALYGVMFALGLTVSIPLGQTINDFNGNCLLYTTLKYRVYAHTNGTKSLGMDSLNMKWTPVDVCWFSTYLAVFVTMYAVIWGWFFILYSGKEIPYWSRIRVLVIAVCFDMVIFVCVVVSTFRITLGFGCWCKAKNMCKPDPIYDQDCSQKEFTCEELSDHEMKWDGVVNGPRFYSLLMTAQVASWLMAVLFGATIVTTIGKIYTYIKKPHIMGSSITEINPKDAIMTLDNPTYISEKPTAPVETMLKQPTVVVHGTPPAKSENLALVAHDVLADNYGTNKDGGLPGTDGAKVEPAVVNVELHKMPSAKDSTA